MRRTLPDGFEIDTSVSCRGAFDCKTNSGNLKFVYTPCLNAANYPLSRLRPTQNRIQLAMPVYRSEVSKPTEPRDFEELCARVYGEVWGDRMPSVNGRSGTKQGGIDVIVRSDHPSRLAIQCKRYALTKLTKEALKVELNAVDKSDYKIDILIFATTAPRDPHLLQWCEAVSDERAYHGKFPVRIEFWDDICAHIRAHEPLRRNYIGLDAEGFRAEWQEAEAQRQTYIDKVLSRIESMATSSSPPDQARQAWEDVPTNALRVERKYVFKKPVGNAETFRPYCYALVAFGWLGFAAGSFAPLVAHYHFNGLVMMSCLLLFLVGSTGLIASNLLRHRVPILSSPFTRGLLLEASPDGSVFLTRVSAVCPQCKSTMKYQFVGPWQGPMRRILTCPRNGSAHNIEFDFTTMPDAGTDL
jgi:hypothetical protein